MRHGQCWAAVYWLRDRWDRMPKTLSQTLPVSVVHANVHDRLQADPFHRPRKDTSTPTSTASEATAATAISQPDKLPTPPRSVPSESLPTPLFNPDTFDFTLAYQDASCHMSSSAPTTTCDDITMAGTMPLFSGRSTMLLTSRKLADEHAKVIRKVMATSSTFAMQKET